MTTNNQIVKALEKLRNGVDVIPASRIDASRENEKMMYISMYNQNGKYIGVKKLPKKDCIVLENGDILVISIFNANCSIPLLIQDGLLLNATVVDGFYENKDGSINEIGQIKVKNEAEINRHRKLNKKFNIKKSQKIREHISVRDVKNKLFKEGLVCEGFRSPDLDAVSVKDKKTGRYSCYVFYATHPDDESNGDYSLILEYLAKINKETGQNLELENIDYVANINWQITDELENLGLKTESELEKVYPSE